MTFQRDYFEDFNDNVDGIVYFVDKSSHKPLRIGTIRLKFPRFLDFLLHDVLYLLELWISFMSTMHIRNQGNLIYIFDGIVEIRRDSGNMVMIIGVKDGRLLKLKGTSTFAHNFAYHAHQNDFIFHCLMAC